MPNRITSEELLAADPDAHGALMRVPGMELIVEIETDGSRHSALVRVVDDPDVVTLHYGQDTALEWLEF